MSLDDLVAAVSERLSERRLEHVRAVAETAAEITRRGEWSVDFETRVVRAAWYHDAFKNEADNELYAWIVAGGEEPDPWSTAFEPRLLHAQAAAVWAVGRGERDAELVSAVRHHPTGHPAWSDLGSMLFVADFTEPTRAHGQSIDLAGLRESAARGPESLRRTARKILGIRLSQLLGSCRLVHPLGLETWNAWAGEARDE